MSTLISISPDEFSNISGDLFDFLPREWQNTSEVSSDSSEVSSDSSEVSFDSSEVSFDSSEVFFLSSGTIWEILREKFESSER